MYNNVNYTKNISVKPLINKTKTDSTKSKFPVSLNEPNYINFYINKTTTAEEFHFGSSIAVARGFYKFLLDDVNSDDNECEYAETYQ